MKYIAEVAISLKRQRIFAFIASKAELFPLLCADPCTALLVDGHHLPQALEWD
jgi:hypothetical protein